MRSASLFHRVLTIRENNFLLTTVGLSDEQKMAIRNELNAAKDSARSFDERWDALDRAGALINADVL